MIAAPRERTPPLVAAIAVMVPLLGPVLSGALAYLATGSVVAAVLAGWAALSLSVVLTMVINRHLRAALRRLQASGEWRGKSRHSEAALT